MRDDDDKRKRERERERQTMSDMACYVTVVVSLIVAVRWGRKDGNEWAWNFQEQQNFIADTHTSVENDDDIFPNEPAAASLAGTGKIETQFRSSPSFIA